MDAKENPFATYDQTIVGNIKTYSNSNDDGEDEKKKEVEEKKKKDDDEKRKEIEKKKKEDKAKKKEDYDLMHKWKIIMQESTFLPNLNHVESKIGKVVF